MLALGLAGLAHILAGLTLGLATLAHILAALAHGHTILTGLTVLALCLAALTVLAHVLTSDGHF